ncbi:MAG: alpha/beta hydrolase-fold protein [Longimicrobiales bacterium]
MNRRKRFFGIVTGSNRSCLARAIRGVLLLILFPPSPAPGACQADGDPIALGHYRVLHSDILAEDRILQVHLPQGYDTGGQAFPVMYLFYSDWVEGYFAQAVNDLYHLTMDRIPPVILVGVPNTQRYRDLYPWPMQDGQGGEAERFLAFVQHELFPFVEEQYRTEPYRILVGPQAAAVFGAYALLEAPGAFQAFLLNDPCRLDSEERGLCPDLVAFARTPRASGKYFAVSHDAGDDRWDTAKLEALRAGFLEEAVDGFRWKIETDQEWPFFLAPVEIRAPLLDLFVDYPFSGLDNIEGWTDIEAHYRGLSRKHGFAVDPPVLVLSRAADRLAESGEHAAALGVLQHLVEIHPSSLDGPWRLANLYRVMGDTTTAIRYYEECLRRDPNLTPARQWLERLRGGG